MQNKLIIINVEIRRLQMLYLTCLRIFPSSKNYHIKIAKRTAMKQEIKM